MNAPQPAANRFSQQSHRDHGEAAEPMLTIPLLHDHHTHPLLYAAFLDGLDLRGLADLDSAAATEKIRDHVGRDRNDWSIVYGWSSERQVFDRRAFEDLSPLVIFDTSLHGILINAAGCRLLEESWPGVTAHVADQDWIERNLRLLLNLFAAGGARPGRLQDFYRWLLNEHGVWSAEEMLLVSADEIRLFREAGLSHRTCFWAAPEQFDALPDDLRAEVHGIKLFTDGALGARTAALHEPYAGSSDRGLLIWSDEELVRMVDRYARQGKPLAIHAIGDRAIDQTVEAISRARPPEGHGIRLEHVQFISLATARKARELGLKLCMQPNFSNESIGYADRLPAGYPERNNPFRMLIDEAGFVPGVDLVLGSDGMPHGVAEALSQSLFPPLASQVLTVAEFVAGYCVPDFSAGQIEVEIDSAQGRVRCRVMPARDSAGSPE